jgi:hypothetical protein
VRLVAAKYGTGMFEPFDTMGLFDDYYSANSWEDLKPGDCLVVWGGADISPSLYNHKVSERTGADEEPSFRDKYEWALMNRAKELGIPYHWSMPWCTDVVCIGRWIPYPGCE